MKTEFLKSLSLKHDVIAKIQAESGKDVQKEKEKLTILESEVSYLKSTVSTYKTKLKAFEGVDVFDLKNQIQTLQNDIKANEENVKKQQEDAKLTATILELLKGKEFVNDFTKNSIINTVKEEINKPDNKGKGIGELLETLTKDTDNIFKNENSMVQIPNMGNVAGASNNHFSFDFTFIHKNLEK